MSAKKDMTGQVIGRLTVVRENGRSKGGQVMWLCKCSCPIGNEVTVRGASLRNGTATSCGCLARDKLIERNTKHGLKKSNLRLYNSVSRHFYNIRQGIDGYQNWKLDARYSDDVEGVVKFCRDLLALKPEACTRYEADKTLNLDKDNDAENVFRPESVVFIPASENQGKQYTNYKLDDGCSLSEFCRRVGIPTREDGKKSKPYHRIQEVYRKHHKAHPELVQKANELIALYTKTLKMVKLLEDARRFASAADVQKLLQKSNQESVSLRLVARHTAKSRRRNCKQEEHHPHL